MKTNEVTNTTKLTKKHVLDALVKIKIDHGIPLSEKEVEAKINLLFEDAKAMTAEAFLYNCEFLRKSELYGRMPANHRFINPTESKPIFNPADWQHLKKS